jgi:hypothetical protein
MLSRAFVFTAMLLLALAASPARAESDFTRVSLVRLLADPEAFHGKLVETAGVLELGFESNGVFLTKEHMEAGLTINAIWVTPSAQMQEDRKTLRGAYVIVAGRFNAHGKGHMGLYSGMLEDVQWAHRQPGT